MEDQRRREKEEEGLKEYWANVAGSNPLGVLVRLGSKQWVIQDWNTKKSELAVSSLSTKRGKRRN